ncbi:lysophospholipase catalytic domain-containing protein [Microdochium trichocladiopsis]|uniref:Lysophospholipase n=1 Tax=Microdochium trichocladiopsis TaxID=1682393 RepID=A0A9P9BJD5_9PEZI|nr:lysophospholipase catalytic domain-containing protein [Microdochium trichocladiopsis]KAH7017985.1 lysophospholipase catalytic domain-containing protein [Microdochium trichocladiopsis]
MGIVRPILGALATAVLLADVAASTQGVDIARAFRATEMRRALPDNPSGGYAPAIVDCPSSRPAVRNATRLSPNETEWLSTRRNNTMEPITALLKRINITGFDVDEFMSSAGNDATVLPNIAIAASGGGYRALMNGAGFIAAADSRVAGSNETGGISGLLQSATYLAGLSGGGWLVGSIYANNFSTVPALQAGNPDTGLWAFDSNILEGPSTSGAGLLSTAEYWATIYGEVQSKDKAGFNTSLTDYWGRALSFQLINDASGGPAYTFSSISRTPGFNDAEQPLPILVADERSPGTLLISLNSTVFEFNPWEMGSWDPTVYGFAPLEYIGSNFTNGTVSNATGQQCVRGFDQYGFLMGTSSSLFNQLLLLNISSLNVPGFVQDALTSLASELGEDDDDIAQYAPNPFFHYNDQTNPNAFDDQLSLVDGGSDLQNIPLHPLIQPERAVDVIFAIDSSADVNNWPNATALRATYQRSLEPIGNGTKFPAIPSAETFINLGLNRRPTAFGCNAGVASSNSTSNSSTSAVSGNVDYPLVVYIPNTPYTALSNVSTFQMSYDDATRNDIIQNGYNVATMGNGTLDASWPKCVGCFILERSLVRTGRAIPTECQACFRRFCYNGTVDNTPVPSFEPIPFLQLTNASSTGGAPTATAGSANPSHTNAAARVVGGLGYDGAVTAFLVALGALAALL